MSAPEAIILPLLALFVIAVGSSFWFYPQIVGTLALSLVAFILGLKFIDKAMRSH